MEDPHSPAGNALTHGLTARRQFPAALTASIEAHLERLRTDPHDGVHELLLREVARHAAFLDVAAAAEQAALRVGAAVALAHSSLSPTLVTADDAILSSAVASDQIERVACYRRAHEKGFHQALSALRTAEQLSTEVPPRASTVVWDEARCREYLARRLRSEEWRCPRCQCPRGAWLASRLRRECARCGHQAGLRAGTIFEQSPLPLASWMSAIVFLRTNRAAALDDLELVTGLGRRATLRRIQRKILEAIESPEADQLLAGLQNPQAWGRVPETGAPFEGHFTKRGERTRRSAGGGSDLLASTSEIDSVAKTNREPEPGGAVRVGGESCLK